MSWPLDMTEALEMVDADRVDVKSETVAKLIKAADRIA